MIFFPFDILLLLPFYFGSAFLIDWKNINEQFNAILTLRTQNFKSILTICKEHHMRTPFPQKTKSMRRKSRKWYTKQKYVIKLNKTKREKSSRKLLFRLQQLDLLFWWCVARMWNALLKCSVKAVSL